MPTKSATKNCKLCKEPFPTQITFGGKRRDLWARSYCLQCSPFGARNNKKLEQIRTDGLKTCGRCRCDLPISSFYKLSSRNGIPSAVCMRCDRTRGKARWRSLKAWCVEYLGGECARCSYNKCLAALDFHHRDPQQKKLAICRMMKSSKAEMKRELDKCDLLCKNCHAEEHATK